MNSSRNISISHRSIVSCSRVQHLCLEPNVIRIIPHARSYVKGKERGKSKKHNNGSADTPRTAPTYRDVHLVKAKYNVPVDEDSKPRPPGRWQRAGNIAIFWANVFVKSLRSRSQKTPDSQKIPDWTPHPPRKGMDLEMLSKRYEMWTRIWRFSAAYRDIATFLRSNEIDVTACMCLCLGTLSGRSWTTRFNSCDVAMSQLVAFESMVGLLRKFTPSISRHTTNQRHFRLQ